MGFSQVSFPVSLLLRSVAAMRAGLEDLRKHGRGETRLQPFEGIGQAREILDAAVNLTKWRSIETEFGQGG
jgi:hypothetical protein